MGSLRAMIRASRRFAGRLLKRKRFVETGGDEKLRRRRSEVGGFGTQPPYLLVASKGRRRICAAWRLSNLVSRSWLSVVSNALQSMLCASHYRSCAWSSDCAYQLLTWVTQQSPGRSLLLNVITDTLELSKMALSHCFGSALGSGPFLCPCP
jgi:hypothetical protein